jgi:hypothetical protein
MQGTTEGTNQRLQTASGVPQLLFMQALKQTIRNSNSKQLVEGPPTLRMKIMPARGPLSDLCVVVVTTSAYSKGESTTPAATRPLMWAMSTSRYAPTCHDRDTSRFGVQQIQRRRRKLCAQTGCGVALVCAATAGGDVGVGSRQTAAQKCAGQRPCPEPNLLTLKRDCIPCPQSA